MNAWLLRRWCKVLTRLRQDQHGAVALTYLLCLPLIFIMLLAPIDFIRYSLAQSKLQNALDAAVISAGRRLDTYDPKVAEQKVEWRDDAIGYFYSNMPKAYLGATILAPEISYSEEKSELNVSIGQLITMRVEGSLPLLVTGLIKKAAFGLAAENEALRKTRSDLEVVLALDNSGSMDDQSGVGGTRMDVLKASSKRLVDTLFSAANREVAGFAKSEVNIGVVPFTGTVRVDNERGMRWANATWLLRPEIKLKENYLKNLWTGCLAEPRGDWSKAHPLPPQVLSPTAEFQPLFMTYSFYFSPKLSKKSSISKIINFDATSDAAWYDRRVFANISNDGRQVKVNLAVEQEYCTQAMLNFLNDKQSEIKAGIDRMSSYGDTGVPVGLLWAWRMLAPAWRGERGWGDEELPQDPAPGRLNKIIVLLSDGENSPIVQNYSEGYNYHYAAAKFQLTYEYQQCGGRSCKTRSRGETVMVSIPPFRQCPVNPLKMYDPTAITPESMQADCSASVDTDIGYDSGGYNNGTKLTASAYDGYMSALCSAVKNDGNGIKIYTVTLGDNVGAAGTSIMRKCSSGAGYYFDAKNVGDLPGIFAAIAGSLTELRLAK